MILRVGMLITQSEGFHHNALIASQKNIKCPLKTNKPSKDISVHYENITALFATSAQETPVSLQSGVTAESEPGALSGPATSFGKQSFAG